jgi:hypothetical protein
MRLHNATENNKWNWKDRVEWIWREMGIGCGIWEVISDKRHPFLNNVKELGDQE